MIYLIALTLTLLLILSSCQPAPRTKIITGHEGLRFQIFKENPSSMVLEGETENVVVKVTNMGGASTKDPGNGGIHIWWNLEPSSIIESKTSEYVNGEKILLGRFDTLSRGESDVIYLGSFTLKNIEDTEFKYSYAFLKIFTCYPYYTLLQDSVCIDLTRLAPTENRKICEEKPVISYPYGQGAPVSIYEIGSLTKIKNGTLIPSYRIKIRNYGKGLPLWRAASRPVEDNSVSRSVACLSLNPNDLGDMVSKVKISAYLSTEKLECNPEVIKLEDGEGETICTLTSDISAKLTPGNTYRVPLTVRLDYSYFEEPIFRKILIKNN